MVGGKRVLGICVSKLSENNEFVYVNEIYKLAKKLDYVVVIYNIFSDVASEKDEGEFLTAVAHLVDYSYVDALIVLRDELITEKVVNTLVKEAVAADAPRVLIGMYHPDAFCVEFQGRDAEEAIVRHVVETHGCRNVYYIGSKSLGEEDDEYFEIFKEVLDENKIENVEDRAVYTDDDFDGGLDIIRYWSSSGVAPDAIVCRNDILAMNVSRALNELGYSVPESVIVTGFGGDDREQYHYPRLTSAATDYKTTALIIVDMLKNTFGGERFMKMALKQQYNVIHRHSCGCKKTDALDYTKTVSAHFDLLNAIHISDLRINAVSGELSNVSDKEALNRAVTDVLPRRSYISLADAFWEPDDDALNEEVLDKTMTIIRAKAPMLHERKQIFPQGIYFPNADTLDQAESAVEVYMLRYASNNFGYYVSSFDFNKQNNMRKERFVNMLDATLNGVYNRFLLKRMTEKLENLQVRDPLTGVYNIKGFVRRVSEKYTGKSDSKLIIISFDISHFRRLNEEYGHEEGDVALLALAEIIRSSASVEDICGRNGADEYLLAIETVEDIEYIIFNYMNSFYQNLKNYNSIYEKQYTMDVHTAFDAGQPRNEEELKALIDSAVDKKNRKKKIEESTEVVTQTLSEKDIQDIKLFEQLIAENKFKYMFQPIVNAKNGSIYAYEALMRTTGGIELSPIRILEIAAMLKRLPDIEYATFSNVLAFVKENESFFGRKKVFINSIVGERLSSEEMDKLIEKYNDVAQRVVVEMTEQTDTTDKEYGAFVNYLSAKNIQTAIDDYGTGYSNTSRLIEYTPAYVKIDRSLITGIHSDFKKQHFVSAIVQFAHDNGFCALAEGVETALEMKSVIKFGIDYIQGYYTARPSFDVLQHIDSAVEREILSYNTVNFGIKDDKGTFAVGSDEEIFIDEIVARNFNKIFITGGNPILKSNSSEVVNCGIIIADGYRGTVTLDSLNIANFGSVVQIGLGTDTYLNLVGENNFFSGGITVPSSSDMHLKGSGSLSINIENDRVVAIGGTCDTAYGRIFIDLPGGIKMKFAADMVVGIGGGYNDNDYEIHIDNTPIHIESSVSTNLGIGTLFDDASVYIKNSVIEIVSGCREFTAIGSKRGNVAISFTDSKLIGSAGGNEVVGIGTRGKLTKDIIIKNSVIDIDYKAKEVFLIGASTGNGHIVIEGTVLKGIVESADATLIGTKDKQGYLDFLQSKNEIYMTSELGVEMSIEEENITIVP